MNVTSFGNATRERAGNVFGEARPDGPLDTAWLVLEAANDFGDELAVAACRRIIDADLNGAPVSRSDLQLVTDYFR